MTPELIEKIQKLMTAFSNGRLIDCSNILKIAEKNKIGMEQLIEYGQVLRDLAPPYDPANFQSVVVRQCPECKTRVLLRMVKTPTGPQNVFGYRSCWECPSCGWEKYSCLCYNSELKTQGYF